MAFKMEYSPRQQTAKMHSWLQGSVVLFSDSTSEIL
jgi:hypothetical protein